MKAVRMHESGGVDKFVYEDAPDPQPSHNDVLVRVKGCALNHLEAWAAKAPAGTAFSTPRILGSDVAGVVEALGDGVRGWEVGAPVMLHPGISCHQCGACLSGRDNLCPSYRLIGQGYDGGLAELVAVPAVNLIRKPENLGFEDAAAIPLTFVTAWHMMLTRAGLRRGDTVLVNAAGSGVGVAAIQVAKLHGARVIASAGSQPKLDKARELGADDLVDYNSQDLAEEVGRLTNGRGVDLVVENVGSTVFEASLRAMARDGRLVTCGATAGANATVNVTRLFLQHQTVLGSFMGTKAELLAAMPYFASGQLKPVVDRVYPLGEIRDAVQHMLNREQFGKIVLVP
jgi:NADPH:quinone reductase-like Zn-dependent oxidoreductase